MHSGTNQTSFLVRSEDNELLKTQAFQCSLPGDKNFRVYTCKAYSSLEKVDRPDLVVIGVKNYSLSTVMDTIEKAFGTDIPVMSVLNGVSHINLISDRFPNALFATIAFNAYRTTPKSAVAVGGTIGLSASNPNSKTLQEVHKILKRKISVSIIENPMDAAHCKLVFNLGNALFTIVGFHDNRNRELPILQKLTAIIMWEGVQVIKKHGVKEVRISGMPSWIFLWLSKTLPTSWVLPMFIKKTEASSINSMAQDLATGSNQTELEEINGYFLELANKVNVEVPYNSAVYAIFKEWVGSSSQPLKPSELLARINSFSNL